MSADSHDIDVSRLDALVKLKSDEEAVRTLLEKAISRRDQEMAVYARVIADYQKRIAALGGQAQAVRERALEALRALETQHDTRREAVERAHAQLQECEFRHQLGEFTPEQFANCQQAAQTAIAAREAEFEAVRSVHARYTELLSAELGASAVSAPVTPVAPVITSTPAVPPATKAAAPPVAPPPAAPAPPAAVAPVPSTPPAPPVATPSARPAAPVAAVRPEPDATVYMAQPSPDDFKLPGQGPTTEDSGAFGTVLIASPLLIEQRSGLPGSHHRLGLLTTIGRTADNQIVVPLKDVSRRHAEIAMKPNGYVLKDLDSPNGTFVNGARITEHLLQDGDSVMIGEHVFVFQKP